MQKLEDDLSWRRRRTHFDRQTLAAAAAEFNRYNREKLVIADPAAARMTIGGDIPVEQLRPCLAALRKLPLACISKRVRIRNRCQRQTNSFR